MNESSSLTEPTEATTESQHRVRRTFATLLGGLGIVLLGLGLVSLVLMSFVSSPEAAKSTVKSALNQPDVRDRSRCHQDGHARRGHARGPWRGHDAQLEERRGPLRGRGRPALPCHDPAAPLVSPIEQHGRCPAQGLG